MIIIFILLYVNVTKVILKTEKDVDFYGPITTETATQTVTQPDT